MLFIYTDGASRGNPGPSAIAFLALGEHQTLIKEHAETIANTTNNVAEYSAIITAMEYALDASEKEITITSDSELVISQLNNTYKVKAKHLFKYFDQVKELEKGFKKVIYKHAPRDNKYISRCDEMVNTVLDKNNKK